MLGGKMIPFFDGIVSACLRKIGANGNDLLRSECDDRVSLENSITITIKQNVGNSCKHFEHTIISMPTNHKTSRHILELCK